MTDRPSAPWIRHVLRPPTGRQWSLLEHQYDPMRESGVESRFSISNGFLGVRGARSASRGPTWVSWLHHLTWASWPRTFVAGLFEIPNMEPAVPALVPAPDWLRFRILLDGEPLLLRSGQLIAHQRTLDMRRGLLHIHWHHQDPHGRVVRVRSLRLVSQTERSLGLQLVALRVDQPVQVTFEAWLEMLNAGLQVEQVQPDLGVWHTGTSGKRLAIATAAELQLDGRVLEPVGQVHLTRIWTWKAVPGQHVTFWRMASFARGEKGEAGLAQHSRTVLARSIEAGPTGVFEAHAVAWADRWADCDVVIAGDPRAQRGLRFALYHLVGAANPEDASVSIGARALTGDAYLGHVFWDTEIYLLPFYTFTWPEAARALLLYRFRTLDAARAKAARLGYRGALYAWESADTGEEATPDFVFGPDGKPVPVLCGTQEQHISADVAYAVWQYWLATDDEGFLLQAGAEILLETARFWASRARHEEDGCYHIRGVIGPDEYHENVDDDAFTNGMAQWNVERGLEVAALLRDRWPERWETLSRQLEIAPAELDAWRDVAEHMATGLDRKTGLFEQFAGYFGLEDIDLSQYAGRTVPMDVVLGRERTQASKVVKQADVVMLLALLPDRFPRRVHEVNFRYYEPRTGHGSSLSRAMHALVAARLGRTKLATRYFREAAATDLEDTTAGVAGGVRIAAMGGLWQAAVLGFAGLALRPDGLAVAPQLPPKWDDLSFRTRWRGRCLRVRIARTTGRIHATLEAGAAMTLHVDNQAYPLEPGQTRQIAWQPSRRSEEAEAAA